jgi:crotonobetainyl-CoA:carnitine CoA-transferase CaiB-like acyl-CoA transferase
VTGSAVEAALDRAAREHGEPLGADGPARLRERMEILGIAPDGQVSAGGTCRLLPAADGRWVAVNLSRRDDVELLAAWMGREWDGPVWDAVAGALLRSTAAAAVERAQLLGIPAAVAIAPGDYAGAPAIKVTRPAGSAARRGPVVDLSSLWAGPLCAGLVGDALGRPVLKVESAQRPDGARQGHPAFWARLNAHKEEVTLDLDDMPGRRQLRDLVEGASVVVSASRPRAFTHLGIDPVEVAGRGVVWVSITGYGWSGPDRDRVAFGDDAGVAGGAAVAAGGADDAPVFVLDAVADPLSGLAAARIAVEAAEQVGTGAFVDVCMAGVVADALRRPHYAADATVPGDRGVT